MSPVRAPRVVKDRYHRGGKTMKLTRVRVQNYRSVRHTEWFDIEQAKRILVGPKEAGKTAVLEALQRITPPPPPPRMG